MKFLFGDSTPSSIDIDYIDFAKRVIDLAVELVKRERGLALIEQRAAAVERRTDASSERLREVANLVRGALVPMTEADDDSSAARCATGIERAATAQVLEEIERERARASAELRVLDAEAQAERGACVRELEALLLHANLPDTTADVAIIADGDAYTAVLSGKTSYGVSTLVELVAGASATFDSIKRVGQLCPGLDVRAPQSSGWLRKNKRVAAQNISRHFVTHVTCSPERVRAGLRAQPDGDGGGYNIDIDRTNGALELSQVGKDGVAIEFDADSADIEPLLSFGEQLAVAASELTADRSVVLEASMDELPVVELARPSELAKRAIAAMAPVMREIAERSLSEDELVLRRQIDSGHREEIYVSKRELAETIAVLPSTERGMFEPLGLDLTIEPPQRIEFRTESSFDEDPLPDSDSDAAEIDPAMIVEQTDRAVSESDEDPTDAIGPAPPPVPVTFFGERGSGRAPTQQ